VYDTRYRCVRVRIITHPSLTGDRVTENATDTNHSVIRHNHQTSGFDCLSKVQE